MGQKTQGFPPESPVDSEGIQTKTDGTVYLPVLLKPAEYDHMTLVRDESSATPDPPQTSDTAMLERKFLGLLTLAMR